MLEGLLKISEGLKEYLPLLDSFNVQRSLVSKKPNLIELLLKLISTSSMNPKYAGVDIESISVKSPDMRLKQ